jgi:CspA family cold shock protein
MSELYIGTVKSIVKDRGFMFLSPPSPGQKDIFAHISAFEKAGLRPPQQVGEQYEYRIEQTARGPQAIDLRPVM